MSSSSSTSIETRIWEKFGQSALIIAEEIPEFSTNQYEHQKGNFFQFGTSVFEEPTKRQLENHIQTFFYELVKDYENFIYRSWTQWYPNPKDRGAVAGLTYLLDTLLYEPIQFSIRSSSNIEIFKDRPTLRIETPRKIQEQYIRLIVEKKKWKYFFRSSYTDPYYHHKHFEQFCFNSIVEKHFQRKEVVEKLIFKLLLRTICIKDGGSCFLDAQRIICIVIQNMSLNSERQTQKPEMREFLVKLHDSITQAGLFTKLTVSAPSRFSDAD